MSYKNILQEYCQKNKLELPKYQTNSNGLAHKLEWYATVKIESKNILIETIEPSASKISAEQTGAKLVLDKLLEFVESPKNTIDLEKINSIYLIDLENKPSFNKKTQSDSLYIGFHNALHHSISKYNEWHMASTSNIKNEFDINENNKLLYIIEGGIPNLVDHFMTMFVWPLTIFLSTILCKKVYIVSGDKAGYCTKICLEKALEFNNLNKNYIKIENVSTI